VTYALLPPKEENRTIVSVDMHEMNHIKWVDKANMTACIEAGMCGKALQEQLEAMGYTMGHEPDSAEFSTLGIIIGGLQFHSVFVGRDLFRFGSVRFCSVLSFFFSFYVPLLTCRRVDLYTCLGHEEEHLWQH
jgi:hypothetical protein